MGVLTNKILDEVCLSSDRRLLDEKFIYDYLHNYMYWAKSLTFDGFRQSVENSAVVFGAYHGDKQIGFARVISDCVTFAYLTDVFIVDMYRGLGLSKLLMQAVMDHHLLKGLRRFLLVTEDAGGLYARFGFEPLVDAEHWMQIYSG